jgi:hypothetical protein
MAEICADEYSPVGRYDSCYQVQGEVAGTKSLHILTDGPFAAARRFGNPSLRPAFLLKVAGSEPSGFLPVGR